MPDHDPHLCTKCYEVNKGYEEDSDEVKTCDECGGKVLTLQEAADYIAELQEYKFMLEEHNDNTRSNP